jgi:hypothetical protein
MAKITSGEDYKSHYPSPPKVLRGIATFVNRRRATAYTGLILGVRRLAP